MASTRSLDPRAQPPRRSPDQRAKGQLPPWLWNRLPGQNAPQVPQVVPSPQHPSILLRRSGESPQRQPNARIPLKPSNQCRCQRLSQAKRSHLASMGDGSAAPRGERVGRATRRRSKARRNTGSSRDKAAAHDVDGSEAHPAVPRRSRRPRSAERSWDDDNKLVKVKTNLPVCLIRYEDRSMGRGDALCRV